MTRLLKRTLLFRSIQWRLVIILILITFVLMTVIWVFLNFRVENIFYTDFKDNIKRNYDELDIDEYTTVKELEQTLMNDPVISGLIRGFDKSFTIIRRDTQEIVFSSDPLYNDNPLQFKNQIFKSINLLSVLPANGNKTGEKQAFTRAKKGDFYDYVITQKLSDGNYILFFKYDRQRAIDVIDDFNRIILYGMMFAIFAALGIGVILSRTITGPISDIMHKAENITDGDFGQVLEIKSDDEIGKLAKTFNYMSARLKGMLTEVSSEKNKVETILNYMTDGIIAFSIDGRIIHTNAAVKKMLKISEYDLKFDDFISLFNIKLSLEEVKQKQAINVPMHKVEYNDKYLRIQLATFTDEDNRVEGIIIVIQDITEEHKLENMRREFVANVSHELRTPLTSVKSYTETLLDGALEDQSTTKHFLNVINDETDRMARLVKDLLVLSQHDSGIKLNFEDVSLFDLASSCVERMKHEADKKEQEIRLQIKQNMPLITADRHRIDQLLINIIGNAIKYTPEKGRILVSLYCENQKAIVCVEDNGIGIPEQDLARVFERFYRVDKARSRQMGGTGLGLAIAKEIAILHGGNITARSKMGRGTQVFIELPIKRATGE